MEHAKIEKLLAETIGLDPASVGNSALLRSINSRMRSSGAAGFDEYLERLRQSSDELQQLIEEVVVPETWFFRDPETFAVLAAWAAGRARLRILSSGCCTGEEPYSIGMCLLDAGLSPDQFKIHAIDISRRSLKIAAAGTYKEKSFRTEELGFRDRYFRPVAHGYRIVDAVRNSVKFLEGNLLDGSWLPEAESFHAIFCRNVLIYFDLPAQDRAVQILRQMLVPDGMLFAGAAESFLILQKGFAASGKSRGFVIDRRKSASLSPTRIPDRRRAPDPPKKPALPVRWIPETRKPAVPVAPDLTEAANLANSGRLAEAAEICRTYLAQSKPAAQAYYLLGLVTDAMDRKSEAADHYRKALYLEPDHVDAMSQLALLMESTGDKAGAVRLRQRIERAEAGTRK